MLVKTAVKPDLARVTDGPERRRACELRWQTQVAALIAELRSPEASDEAVAASAPWVARVLKAKADVIDPNVERLTDHMRGMKEEHVSAAARELEGSRLRSVIKAKALSVHKV